VVTTALRQAFFGLGVAVVVNVVGPSLAHADELAPDIAQTFELTTFATGLELPTATEFLPDGRVVITEKTGAVKVRLPKDGTLVEAGKLDVDSKTEKGLLNVIRHPDFVQNHELIFYYSSATAPEDDKHKVSLITLGDDNKLDLSSEKVLVKGLRGPDDHEMGGGLAIDSTGNLLIGVGDTGCRAHKNPEPPYTPTNYFATCLTNGNGKILRVALDGSIPKDNPLVGVTEATTCGEKCSDDAFQLKPSPPRQDIWVWGVRNPWRIWVDPKTGLVWTADVGDISNEEIDIIPKEGGRHYGWPWREGAAGHDVAECKKTLPDRGDCVDPAYYCRHDDAPGTAEPGCQSINGGLIVDDCRWPAPYRGRYYFADNHTGQIWSLDPTIDRAGIVPGSRKDVGKASGFVVDMDVGLDSALYLTVMKIPPEPSTVIRLAPKLLGVCAADAALASASPGITLPNGPQPSSGRAPVAELPLTVDRPHRKRRRLVYGTIAALALLAAAGLALSRKT
jgi:glucose/arabinose dehydrogenase